MNAPCYKCSERCKGCHNSCKEYADYREIMQRKQADEERHQLLNWHLVQAKKKFKCKY